MTLKYLSLAALIVLGSFTQLASSADNVSANAVTAAGMPPPPPPTLDSSFQKQLSKGPSKSEKKSRVRTQKQIDAEISPLTPEQTVHTQQLARQNEKLANYRSEPRAPRDRDIFWSVGKVGETIRMATGYNTTILFFDASGQPVEVVKPGALVGDDQSISANTTGNALVLYVLKPFRTTNLTVFLNKIPVPVQFTLTSVRDPQNADVDYQVRARIMSGAASNIETKDIQNMDSLLKMTNGMSVSNLAVLPVVSVEKGDPSRPLNWSLVNNDIAQFRVGPEGYTYVILRPGFKMVYPNVPNVLASLIGADGTQGYIVGGNNPRMFTVQDTNSAMYRITVQR